MNFEFSAEQEELRHQIRRVLADGCTIADVRQVLEGRTPFLRDLWLKLGELGFIGIGLAEEHDGSGLGATELCILAEELGRVLAPVPFLASRVLVAEAVLRAGRLEQKQHWLPALASGEVIGCFAGGSASPCDLELRRATVTGSAAPVLGAPLSDIAVVHFGRGRDATLGIVSLRQAGVDVQPVETLDPTQPHGRIHFDGAAIEILSVGADALEIVAQVTSFAAVVAAFEQLGGADRCLELARDYSLARRTFGRPIGSYQAIKHKLVDVYVKNTLARGHAYYGAWALDSSDKDVPLAAASARASCTEAFAFAAQENIQVHGGIGFTWEADCHLFYRRARLLALTLGSGAEWKERVMAELERQNA